MKTLLDVLKDENIAVSDSSGGRMVANCPFHTGDETPSFTIYPNDSYYCFGCEAWGDALKFLIEYKHYTFQQAVEIVGVEYKSRVSDKPKVIKVKNTQDTYSFLYDVVEQYHQYLMQMPGAIRYLESRGLTMETIKKFKLGYTDGRVLKINWSWERRLAVESGLLTKDNYELLSHRITIPNLTEIGQCDFIVGRTVTSDKVRYLGIKVPKPLHGFYAVRHSPIIFLAEGQFDWLTLSQWGYPAAVLGGTHLSRNNFSLLRDKKIIIVPDYDDSGVGLQAAKKLQESFGENAVLLDYSEARTSHGKFDISLLGESPGGKFLFDTIVKEQCPWIQFLSNRMLARWLPTFQTTNYLHSI